MTGAINHRMLTEWVGLGGPPPADEVVVAYLRDAADDERDAVEAAVMRLAADQLEIDNEQGMMFVAVAAVIGLPSFFMGVLLTYLVLWATGQLT